jgi:succinate dehydrogenase flavin-adding protein (antitoxin of CptAB toxin-antitoxin module)
MKELDLLLRNYLEQSYPTAGESDQHAFESLLQMPDPELYDLILGRTETQDEQILRVVKVLRHSL